MDVLGFAALVVGGFTACVEFGSYAFVHPVIRRVPGTYHIEVEQELAPSKAGEVTAIGMILCGRVRARMCRGRHGDADGLRGRLTC